MPGDGVGLYRRRGGCNELGYTELRTTQPGPSRSQLNVKHLHPILRPPLMTNWWNKRSCISHVRCLRLASRLLNVPFCFLSAYCKSKSVRNAQHGSPFGSYLDYVGPSALGTYVFDGFIGSLRHGSQWMPGRNSRQVQADEQSVGPGRLVGLQGPLRRMAPISQDWTEIMQAGMWGCKSAARQPSGGEQLRGNVIK